MNQFVHGPWVDATAGIAAIGMTVYCLALAHRKVTRFSAPKCVTIETALFVTLWAANCGFDILTLGKASMPLPELIERTAEAAVVGMAITLAAVTLLSGNVLGLGKYLRVALCPR